MSTTSKTSAPRASDQVWVDVCPEDEVFEGTGVAARICGQQIAIFNTREGWYALSNHDPFSSANVISRGIVGDLGGKLVVASPVYKQHFCLRTGQCLEDETVTLPVYPAQLVDGRIQVAVAE